MKRTFGFTLVELVVVLILLGIVSAVVIPKLTDLTDFRALAFHDNVVSALRYAQKTATSHRRAVCVSFAASSVTLSIIGATGGTNCNTAVALPLPNGATSVDSGDASVAFVSTPTNFSFLFDGEASADSVISITGQQDIHVFKATGYVGYVD